MANNPPNPSSASPWVYDWNERQYVRYDTHRGRWVDERGRASRAPQTTAPAPPPPASKGAMAASSNKAGKSATPSGGIGGASDASVPSIEYSLKRLNIAPPTTKPYTTTGFDKNTGIETLWDITETRAYRDSRTSESTRSLNVKRIRQPKGGSSISGFGVSANPERDYKPGRVVEVALVPPNPNTTSSTLSQITPSPDLPQGRGTRYRRFVVVSQRPEGRNSFEAIAIKTYNGLGVAAPGVIKSHHSIIHTLVPPPLPLPDELPKKRPNGQLEGAMQAMPIKVQQFDLTWALDPKARLDYMDTYEFDYGVTNIRLWGRIHPDSEPTFYTQYSHVFAMVMGAAAGPGPGAGYGSEGDVGGIPPSDTASTAGTITAAQPGHGYSVKTSAYGPSAGTSRGPTGATTDSSRKISVTAPGASSTARGASSATSSGVITDSQMWGIIRKYQDHARKHGYPVPGTSLTDAQVHNLAINAPNRTAFLQRIKDAWGIERGDDSDSDDQSDDE